MVELLNSVVGVLASVPCKARLSLQYQRTHLRGVGAQWPTSVDVHVMVVKATFGIMFILDPTWLRFEVGQVKCQTLVRRGCALTLLLVGLGGWATLGSLLVVVTGRAPLLWTRFT